MFTNKFFKVPIKLQREVKGTDELEFKTSLLRIIPEELATYRPTHDEDFPDERCIHLTLKNGYGFTVYLPIKEFEDLLNKFADTETCSTFTPKTETR